MWKDLKIALIQFYDRPPSLEDGPNEPSMII